ncbi:MAG TPA: hypothetical protein ENN17_02650 [bacterium]|nr:hypothetical protein [bacterium]
MALSEQEREFFLTVIHDLLITVKNCTLYDPEHPIFRLSIQKLWNSLEDWFEIRPSFEIGVSPTRLFLTSEAIGEEEKFSSEIAGLFHARGILSLEIAREIPVSELEDFIMLLRLDGRAREDEERILARFREFGHIRIKEIDYRHLLSAETDVYSTEEEKIWGELFKSIHPDEEDLPPDKVGFLLQFLRSTERSAGFLNRVYRQALRGENDERIVRAFQNVIHQISEIFQDQANPQAEKQFRGDLMRILSHLHPDFISKLFDETVLHGKKFDLAATILRDMTDSDLAGFIETLVADEGSINEYLLRIFNKMVPDEESADRIAPLVADELLSKSLVTPHTLTQIQLSIRELFKQNRSNFFANAMYKITVEAMSEADSDTLTFTVNLSPLVNRFIKTVDENRCREERAWILLKILAQETDPSGFTRFGERLIRVFEEAIEAGDVVTVKELLSYYIHRVSRGEEIDTPLADLKKEIRRKLTGVPFAERIAALIPAMEEVDLDEIANIMLIMRPVSCRVLIDYYLSHPGERTRCLRIFSRMQSSVGPVILKEFDRREPRVVRELLSILKHIDPENLNRAAHKLLKHSDPFLLWEALDNIAPTSREIHDYILKLYLRGKNPEIQRKAMIALLRGDDPRVIRKLFHVTRKKQSRRRFLPDLIAHAGILNVKHAFDPLKEIALKRPLFDNEKAASLRASAADSLLAIDREAAIQILPGRPDGRVPVRGRRKRHDGKGAADDG